MSEKLAAALQSLRGLSADELEQVRKHVMAMQQFTSAGHGSHVEVGVFEAVVLDAIVQVCADAGLEPIPTTRLAKMPAMKLMRDKLPGFEQWVDRIGLDRVHLRAFLVMGFHMLRAHMRASHIRASHIEVGARGLMLNLHRLPEVMDNSFPGYAEAGLLSSIVHAQFNGGKLDVR